MDPASLLLPVLLIAVFYFLLIRPQQKQRRKIAEIQASLAPGARVMTGAGLIGTVTQLDGDEVVLEVAPGVNNRYVRRAIITILDSAPPPTGIHDDTVGERPRDDANGDDSGR